jgi:hypothetical protein
VDDYPWSSCALYLKSKGKRPRWLRTDRLLGEHGIVSEEARGRREFSRRMEAAREDANDPERLTPIRRGWKLGSEDFLDWIVEKVELRPGEGHSGRQRDETKEHKAEHMVMEAMKRLGWTKRAIGTQTPLRSAHCASMGNK